MTKSQAKAIDKLRKSAEMLCANHRNLYEIKDWIQKDEGSFLSLRFSIGLKYGEVTTSDRDRFLFFIGSHGGITYPVQVQGRFHNMRYDGRLLEVAQSQDTQKLRYV